MKADKTFEILKKMAKPKPTIVYDTYWRFATERQSIFFKRIQRQIPPWTKDPILHLFKFTNTYRITDRVSQYLISNVIYTGSQKPNEVLFRILVFKLFNKIETWEVLSKAIGEIRYDTYNYDLYDKILAGEKFKRKPIYSGAYIMASGKSAFGLPFKHQNHLKLIEEITKSSFLESAQESQSMEEIFNLLQNYPTIGPFLAYQFATDINYSDITNFSEMQFVKAGPGAKDGIRKAFSDYGDYSEEDIIRMMAENQQMEFEKLEIKFQDLWGRPLQLIDCQNIFCEVDKYSRVAHPEIGSISNRKRIKQKFTPTSLVPILYKMPPKWGINIG